MRQELGIVNTGVAPFKAETGNWGELQSARIAARKNMVRASGARFDRDAEYDRLASGAHEFEDGCDKKFVGLIDGRFSRAVCLSTDSPV